MKWFQHLCDSAHDPDIAEAEIRFGSDGYMVFYRTLEIMGREFKIHNPGHNCFAWAFFRKNFRISAKKLTKILSFFDKVGRIKSSFEEDDGITMIRLYCPKLKELTDRYTKKALKKMSVQNPDNVGTIEPEPEEDISKRVSREDTLSSPDKPPTTARPPTCPHKEIIQAYHEMLPELPPVKTWGENRRAYLRSRWKEDRARQSIDWWRGFFKSVREQPHLMGKNGWMASLEWLIRPKNFPKVLEGHYRDNGQPWASPGKMTPDEQLQHNLSGLKSWHEKKRKEAEGEGL